MICKRSLSVLAHVALHVRLLDSVQLLSLLFANPIFWLYCVPLHAINLLDHSTLECYHTVFAAPSETVPDFRID